MRSPAGVPARIVVTDLDGAVTTWIAGKSLLKANATINLGLPSQLTFDVRSGDPAVNMIFPDDSDPLIAQSNRLAYLFLREAPLSGSPWVCRASGIIMSPQDEADPDTSTSHLVAFDPWQYIMGRPCFMNGSGTPIGTDGRPFFAKRGDEIVLQLLADTISSEGIGCFIDYPDNDSGYYTGTIEDTPELDGFTVQQGTTLGDAWNQVVSAGDPTGGSGCCDIILEPIYDPGTDISPHRPGYLSQISIYNLAGIDRPGTPMAWARFNRSVMTANREHDGTPGSFVNVTDFHVGQGGEPVPLLGPPPSNAPSVAKYRPYWQSSFFPNQESAIAVAAMEQQILSLQAQGKRTFTVNPDPLRAGMPFRDYNIGDRVPVYSTNGQRVGASGYQRVQTIPLEVTPDGVTSVQALLTSPDWPQS